MRRPSAPLALWLTAVWVGLWGSVTPANVLGGLAVALGLLVLLPQEPPGDRAQVRPVALLRFAGRFLVDLCVSSASVLALALRPGLHLRSALVAVEVPGASDTLLTVLGNAISLTPGTLTVDVDQPRATLYVHVLDVGDGPDAVERRRAALLDQARAAVRAFGSPDARARVGGRSRAPGDRRQEDHG